MLKAGDKAPDFSLDTDSGRRVSLRDYADKVLILYFYPRDNTPGCTREAQAFSAAQRAIEMAGGAVLGVSRDTVKSHQGFIAKCNLSIPLLSDADLTLHKAYGAWGEKTMYGKKVLGCIRSTFLIKDGHIARAWPSVKVDGHADAVLQAIGELSSGGPSSRRIGAPSPAAAPPKAKVKAPKKAAAKTAKKAAPKKAAPKKAAPKKAAKAKANAKKKTARKK